MADTEHLRFAVLRALDEALPEGIADEDLAEAVGYLVEGVPLTQVALDAVTESLWTTGFIEHDDERSPWRIVEQRSGPRRRAERPR